MNRFKSDDHVFRPTGLAAALKAAGAIENIAMVREPKRAISRINEDTGNREVHTLRAA